MTWPERKAPPPTFSEYDLTHPESWRIVRPTPAASLPVSRWRGAIPAPTWETRSVRVVVHEVMQGWSQEFWDLGNAVLGTGYRQSAGLLRATRVRNAFIVAVFQGHCGPDADGSVEATRLRFDKLLETIRQLPSGGPTYGFDIWLGRCDTWGTPFDPPIGWAWPWDPWRSAWDDPVL